MKKVTLSLVFLAICCIISFAQLKVETAGVGIGDDTQTPAEKLEVFGGLKIGTTTNTNAGTMRWTGTDFEGYDGATWKSLSAGGSAGDGLWKKNSVHVYYENGISGRVGIGIAQPARTLHLSGNNTILRVDRSGPSAPAFMFVNQDANLNVEKAFLFANAGSAALPYFYIADAGTEVSGPNTRRFVINGNTGNISIGSAVNPTEKLYVQGNAYKTEGGSSWEIPSDRRLKKGIKPLEEGLDIILRINPVKYFYNGRAGTDTKKEQVGIVAQELQKLVPYMVSNFTYIDDKDNGRDNIDSALPRSKTKGEDYLKVNDSSIKYILINAIKEQQLQIIELRKEIELLKKK